MERKVLQLFGFWTELQSLMKDYTLMELEGDAAIEYAEKGKYSDSDILDDYKKVVRNVYRLGFPVWFSDSYKGAKKVRDKLAHMINISSITGERPHRVMTIVRTNGFERYEPEEGIWLQHRYEEQIREEDLTDGIQSLKAARSMLNQLHHMRVLFEHAQPADDDIWNFDWVPWWDGRWGAPPTEPEGYMAPVGRYRYDVESKEGRKYWEPDKRKWWRETTES
ncbi:MAG: hypothetical protein HYZ38_28985 [Mycobacterium sp.]|nr:hypothetical protein [Mycobacterium sp.]